MFVHYNYLEGQNIYCQVWAFTNCVILVIEPVFEILQILFNKKYSAMIKIDDLFTKEVPNEGVEGDKSGMRKEDLLAPGAIDPNNASLGKSMAQ